WEPARPAEDFARIETLEGGDTILGERENDFWIRVSDGQDRPSPAHIEVLLDGQRIAEFFLGALGLGRVRVPLSKPAHELTVVAAVTGAEGRRVEDIAPLGRIRIQPTPPVIRVSPGTPARGLLVIDSEAVTERLLCGLWRGDTLIDLFAVPAPAGRARHEITVPGDGIYRVTCTDHPASEWWGDSFLVATRSPDALLDSFREALAGEPFFAGWPPSSELSPGELDLALGYLLDRAERSTLPWTRLLDTREGDQARLDAEGRRVRMAILGLIAATGFSLLLWAVAMVLRQRRTLAAIRDPELLGAGALQEHGLGRRGALLPLAFLVLATLVNVGALIYILVLVLH
ncbi:MAG: hypothetical protein FJ098_03455, partial [Deltaproteobacteria bacterium]|nr:hypothetical protein [Deltaproteobacteria bacterium]